MGWQRLTLRLPAEAYARTEALLQLAGATSIAISDDGDSPILEPDPGTTPLWPTVQVQALFAETADLSAIGALLGPFDDGDVVFDQISEQEVEAGLRQSVSPLEIGPRLTVVPAEQLADARDHAIGLHMGLAFGTGQHPTTRLCLEWLEREMRPGWSVLDYGAGSGILALAALKLGASLAVALDNEPQAVEATRRNAGLNGMTEALTIGPPDTLADATYDLILANILAGPLIELETLFASHQTAGGRIVLSGIVAGQMDEIESAYGNDYDSFDRKTLQGWGLLTAIRSSGYDR